MSSHPADPDQQKSSYIVDAENTVEMTRLTHQDRLLTKSMGGLFPASFDLSHCHDVLDIGCGPGRWVLDVAFEHRNMRVVGIDVTAKMVEYARAQARVQGVDNALYQVMDATKPLAFADNSFDIVNARTIVGFMARPVWPALMQECKRILRPGGILRLTELEWFITNKPAVEKMGHIITQGLHRFGRGFSPDGMAFCITPMLEGFLHEADFQHIDQQAYALNFSMGTEYHEGFYQNLVIAFALGKEMTVILGTMTPEEYHEISNMALAELMQSDFRGIVYSLSAWGGKPL